MNNNKFILIGLLFIPISIVLGAVQAHYLNNFGIPEGRIESFGVGVKFLMYNGIASLAVAGIASQLNFDLKRPYRSILWGTVIFSSSIFLFTFLPNWNVDIPKYLPLLTPLGGLIMIHGWFVLLMRYLRTHVN